MSTQLSSLPRRWLVFRLGHLGDVTLSTGVLERLAALHGWRFAFLTRPAWASLFEHNPQVTEVLSPGAEDLALPGWLAYARRLAQSRRDWGLLDLHGTARSRLLAALWQGPVRRYDKMTLERRFFLASKGRCCAAGLRSLNVPQRYYRAVDTPPPASELRPRLYLSDQESAEAGQRLAALFGPGARPVALHPFAAHPLKTWSHDRWRQLAALLDARGMAWIAVGRGPSPFQGRANDLSNVLSLRQSAAVLSLCRTLVSGDSGPMHLAASVDTPVVALFGPTSREWGFFPTGPDDVVLELPLPCRPCSLHGGRRCSRNGHCLEALRPEDALKAIELHARRG